MNARVEKLGARPVRGGQGCGEERVDAVPSKRDGWQKNARGFVVQAEGHQGHRLDDTKAVLEAPAEELRVAVRQQESRSGEFVHTSDKGLQVSVGFGYGVAEESDDGSVARDTRVAFDEARHTKGDHVRHLARTVVAVDAMAERVARGQIAGSGRPDRATAGYEVNRRPLQHYQRFANVEAQLGVKRQGTGVKSGLHEPHPRGAARSMTASINWRPTLRF